jgi:hypothetical protein
MRPPAAGDNARENEAVRRKVKADAEAANYT